MKMKQETVKDIHLGNKKAFGNPKIIWINSKGKAKIFTISQKLYDELLKDGMSEEG